MAQDEKDIDTRCEVLGNTLFKKDIALKVWGKAPLLDLAENWHGDRSLGPEQCSNDPQAPISTP